MQAVIFIAFGATLGAIARWQIGVWLNPLFSALAAGTLVVNLLGCLLIGIALGLHLQESHKLFFITGFLGSFTTFSAFSADIVQKGLEGKWLSGLAIWGLHTFGGLLATLLGIAIAHGLTSGR